MRRQLIWPAAVFAVACVIDPEDEFFLRGRLLDEQGAPVAGATISVDADRQGRSPRYTHLFDEKTFPEGDYVVSLPYGLLRPVNGNGSFRLQAGALSLHLRYLGSADVTLPDLAPIPASLAHDGAFGFTAATAPGDAGFLEVTCGEDVVWVAESGGAYALDPLVLADREGCTASLRALRPGLLEEPGLAVGLGAKVQWVMETRSPPVVLPAGTAAPVTRGATCNVPPTNEPCALVDGSGDANPLGGGTAVLHLAAPARVRRVLLKGVHLGAAVCVRGRAGETWSELARGGGPLADGEWERRDALFPIDQFASWLALDVAEPAVVDALQVMGCGQEGVPPFAIGELEAFE